jgi:UDP-GlcNAc:undecaprenyl-phosphate GlcNAc-1-phosphate transferase
MSYIILIYSIVSFVIFLSITKISYHLNLVDIPNKRKIHSYATAYTGGIPLSFSILISLLVFDISSSSLNNILSIAFIVSIIGFIDDKYDLNVGGKLSLQIIPIFYLIAIENLYLNTLGNYEYFQLDLGYLQLPFTLFAILLLINSFNYFDGMDGTLSFTSISVIAILFFLVTDQNLELFFIILLIPIVIFIFFNFSIFKLPKIFLGDSGSLYIGFLISFILIYFSNQNYVHSILLAWSVAIFVYEFLSINFIRMKNKKSPFTAGNDHLHDLIYKIVKSYFLTSLFISFINLILFLIGYLTFILISPLASLISFILTFIIFIYLRIICSKKFLA